MKTSRVLAIGAFPLFFALLIVLGIVFKEPLFRIFSSPERLRAYVASVKGAPFVFIALQALQVVLFFIPGEFPQIAGGFLFGIWKGSLLSIAGILLGSSISFALARLLGVPFVYALFKRERVDQVRSISNSPRGQFAFFLFFLIPGIPKDILCYAAGLTPFRLYHFILLSMVGRIPGILGSALIGDAAAESRWLLAGGVFVLAFVLFLLGFLFRTRIEAVLQRIARRKKSG